MSSGAKLGFFILVSFTIGLFALCGLVTKVEQSINIVDTSSDPRTGMMQYAEPFSNTWVNNNYYVITPNDYENIIIDFSVPLLSQTYSDGEWLFVFTEISDDGAHVIACNNDKCFSDFFYSIGGGFNGMYFDGMELYTVE